MDVIIREDSEGLSVAINLSRSLKLKHFQALTCSEVPIVSLQSEMGARGECALPVACRLLDGSVAGSVAMCYWRAKMSTLQLGRLIQIWPLELARYLPKLPTVLMPP